MTVAGELQSLAVGDELFGVLRDALPGWLRASPLGHSIVGIYQAQLSWYQIATTKPLLAQSPSDPKTPSEFVDRQLKKAIDYLLTKQGTEQAKAALRYVLNRLNPADRFAKALAQTGGNKKEAAQLLQLAADLRRAVGFRHALVEGRRARRVVPAEGDADDPHALQRRQLRHMEARRRIWRPARAAQRERGCEPLRDRRLSRSQPCGAKEREREAALLARAGAHGHPGAQRR